MMGFVVSRGTGCIEDWKVQIGCGCAVLLGNIVRCVINAVKGRVKIGWRG